MSKDPALPSRVFPKGRWYYLVVAVGKQRRWDPLSRISDGLPALHRAYAARLEADARTGSIAQLIADWEDEVMPAHSENVRKVDRQRGKVIAEAFVDFLVTEVETPDCSDFLRRFKAMPRTFNAYRAQLRELMRYAEEKGMRPAGSNPVSSLRTMPTPARDRYITDSELRRIKVAAMHDGRSNTGKLTRSGPMLCALIDMAYLSGQAIGDLLRLEWRHLTPAGIVFARGKVEKTTRSKVTIGWTPKLRDVERRLREMRKQRRAFGARVFVRQDGEPYTYWGVSSAWQDARRAAGVTDCTFHDIKAKALTDKAAREGMKEAQAMGQHSTEEQTSQYVRLRSGRKTGATK